MTAQTMLTQTVHYRIISSLSHLALPNVPSLSNTWEP